MPAYNAAAHVAAAVRSAVDQLTDCDELVVQDACSTDGTAELLDDAAAADPRVRVRHEPDSGQSQALNRALHWATGELVGWLNADDLLLPGALDAVRAAVDRHGELPDIVVGGWQLIGPSGAVVRRKPAAALHRPRLLVRGCYAFSGAVLVRRDLLGRIGGYTEHLHYTMDYDLMLRLAGTARHQVLVDAPLAALRYHGESKSGTAGRRFFTEALAVRRGYCHSPTDAWRATTGAILHGLSTATTWLRVSDTYSRLRGKVTSR